MRALFVVGGATQWADALLVADALGPSRLLDLGTLVVDGAPAPGTPYGGVHWPDQGARAVRRLLQCLHDELPGTDVIVLGQDAGRLQQVAAAAARRHGVPVAVVPDGAVFDAAARLPWRVRAQEVVLGRLGLTIGEPLRFGSTQPDLWCAWGEGWVELLQRFSPHGRVVVTGSPRGSSLAALPPVSAASPRVLVCSQPTWVHPFPPSATAGPRWYAWLDAIVQSAPPGRVVVRLHPRERDLGADLPLTEAVRSSRSQGTSLAEDLAACDGVVAPMSTALIEGAAAGRQALSVLPEAGCLQARRGSPATADDRLVSHLVDDLPDFDSLEAALQAAPPSVDWGRSYAVTDLGAASVCASALVAVARPMVAA